MKLKVEISQQQELAKVSFETSAAAAAAALT